MWGSLLYLTHEIVTTSGVPEREHNHVEHDPLLGWVNRPNVHLPDAYGPGSGIRTNSQRFRNAHDFSVQVPPGRVRVICSGDSFTFGYGVDDLQAWCERLAVIDARLETGLLLLDLVEAIRGVPPTEIGGLYAPNAHFSVAGNEWAAQVIQRRLLPVIDSTAS